MIGKRIKELRKEHDKTQRELADFLGLTPKMISFYELEERFPPHDIIIKLSQFFNVSSDYLLGITDIPNNELIEKYLDIIVSEIERIFSYSEGIPIEGGDNYSDSLTNLSKTEKIAAIHSVLKDIKEVNGDLELDFYVHDMPSTDKNLTSNSDIRNPYDNKALSIKHKKEDNDISMTLDRMKKQLATSDSLMFDGQPATEEQVQAILNAIEMGEAFAKQRAKEKFTPNKYRK